MPIPDPSGICAFLKSIGHDPVGVGAAQRTSAVRWGVAGNIVIAWILTIPASAGIAALAWWLGGLLF